MLNKLSIAENRLYTFVLMHGLNTDVLIDDIHAHMYGNSTEATGRSPQQRVGAIVSKINKKLNDYRVVPGALKRTYRVEAK